MDTYNTSRVLPACFAFYFLFFLLQLLLLWNTNFFFIILELGTLLNGFMGYFMTSMMEKVFPKKKKWIGENGKLWKWISKATLKTKTNSYDTKKSTFSPSKMTMILSNMSHKSCIDWCFIEEYRRKKNKKNFWPPYRCITQIMRKDVKVLSALLEQLLVREKLSCCGSECLLSNDSCQVPLEANVSKRQKTNIISRNTYIHLIDDDV